MLYALYLLVVVAIVGLDQISKMLVTTYMELHQEIVVIKDFFSLNYVRNTGVAFSMLSGKQELLKIVTLLALVMFIYLLIFEKNKTKFETACILMMLGGCIGNFIDRLSFGYVIDFFSFNFFGYHFAIFNVADCFLTVGAILYIIYIIRGLIHAKN